MPHTIVKGVRDIIDIGASPDEEIRHAGKGKKKETHMSARDREALIERLTKEMKDAARRLEFEQAAYIRDKIKELKENK